MSIKLAVTPLSPRASGETVTRVELRAALRTRLPTLSHADAARLVDDVFEEIISAFEQGENVKLQGFGVFKVRQKKARAGRNPKTGEKAIVEARRVVTFSPSPKLRGAVNGETLGEGVE